MDYAEEKYGHELVNETKNVVNILILYLPLPVYWAVYQLQFSRWVFQATNMNGDLGFYTVKADQILIVNPIFGLIAVPLNDYVLNPLLAKVKIKSYLQKMVFGGILLAFASVLAGLVQIQIGKSSEGSISMLWLIPQYSLAAFSENFLYNSNLNFAYKEASTNMKSVMTSFVFLTIAFGNVIDMIISGASVFKSQAVEFLFFAGVLLLAMFIFALLAMKYKPVNKKITAN